MLNFFKKKSDRQATDLPPPPPPPGGGLDLELPEPAGLPPLPVAPQAPESQAIAPSANAPLPTPSIPPVSGQNPPEELPDLELGPPPQEPEPMPAQELPELTELEDSVVMEPTIAPPKRMVEQESVKPMFISIEDYQDILVSIGAIKDALADTEVAMNRLNELKNTEERILEDWRSHIEDAERKITYIDQAIFRGE